MIDEKRREQLKKMVKSVMKNDPDEEAQINFHGFFKDKMKAFLGIDKNAESEQEETEE